MIPDIAVKTVEEMGRGAIDEGLAGVGRMGGMSGLGILGFFHYPLVFILEEKSEPISVGSTRIHTLVPFPSNFSQIYFHASYLLTLKKMRKPRHC